MNSIFWMLSHARMFRTRAAAALIAVLGVVVATSGLVVLSSTAASATADPARTLAWDGQNGAPLLPCDGTIHWVFTGTSTATPSLTVGGSTYDAFKGNGNGSWQFLTDGAGVVGGANHSSAVVTYYGPVDSNAKLTISDCYGSSLPSVVPQDPTVHPSSCVNGQGTASYLTAAPGPAGVTYQVSGGTATATIDTAKYRWGTMPAGWTRVSASTATWSTTLPATRDCRTAVVPAMPTINDPGCVTGQPGHTTGGTFTAPADTPTIHYATSGDRITATIVTPTAYVWGTMPTGWTQRTETTATFDVTYGPAPGCSAEITLPGSPPVNPPTCTTDGSFTLPTTPAHVTWTSTGTPDHGVYGPGRYTVTAQADNGYYFVVGGQHVTTRTYTVDVLSRTGAANCLRVPTNNTPTAATCQTGGTYTLPADGGHVAWSVTGPNAVGDHLYGPGTYDVTATALDGYAFADGTTAETWHVVVADRLTGLPCATEVPVPSDPGPTPATCATDGSLTLPATAHVLWVVGNDAPAAGPLTLGKGVYHVVAQTADGYKFAGDVTTHDYGSIKVDARSGDCPVRATAVQPTVTVSTHCGVEGSFTIPATAGVQYLLDGRPVAGGTYSGPATGTVTAVGLGSTVLTNPDFSFALVLPPAAQCPPGTTEVTPAAPTFVDPTCAHPDGARAIYADTDAVDYTQTGTVGLGGTVTVTAVPRTGFTFPVGFVASWTHTFPKGLVCATETSQPKPSHTPTVKPTQATGHHHPSRKPTVLGTEAVAVPTAVDAGLATWRGDTSSPTGSLLGESLVAAGLVLLLAGAALGLGRRRRGEHQV